MSLELYGDFIPMYEQSYNSWDVPRKTNLEAAGPRRGGSLESVSCAECSMGYAFSSSEIQH